MLTGCTLPGAVGLQTLSVKSGASVASTLRLYPFVNGRAQTSLENAVLSEPLPAGASREFELPGGKYMVEAIAVTAKGETATTYVTLEAKPVILHLVEEMTDQPKAGSQTPAPGTVGAITYERVRLLNWEEQ